MPDSLVWLRGRLFCNILLLRFYNFQVVSACGSLACTDRYHKNLWIQIIVETVTQFVLGRSETESFWIWIRALTNLVSFHDCKRYYPVTLDIFSSMNGRFLGAYLRPQQRAVLFAELPPSFQTKNQAAAIINFKVWEATRGLQLKACCDNLTYCVYQTDIGLKRGTRRWLDKEAICPIGTRKVISVLVTILFLSCRFCLSVPIMETIRVLAGSIQSLSLMKHAPQFHRQKPIWSTAENNAN